MGANALLLFSEPTFIKVYEFKYADACQAECVGTLGLVLHVPARKLVFLFETKGAVFVPVETPLWPEIQQRD